MALFLEHWHWTLGAVVALACILGYKYLIRKAQAYTARVKNELEEYVKQSTPSPMTLPIPSRNSSDPATLSDEKQMIWKNIHDHPLHHYQQVDVLVTQLAEARITARFQETYFTIFGSQHAFLRRLNSQTGSGAMSRDTSQAFLQELAAANSSVAQANHNFNQWIAYLVSQGFVNVGIDTISITNSGQDFLVWVTRRQLPERTYEGV
jgi:hypothetical protein